MNKVILMGRLTDEPKVHSRDEHTAARFTLAVDRRIAKNADGQTTADFPSIVAFEKRAEFAEKYLHKGTKVVIVGRIQTGSYTNREGQKVYTTDVIAEDIEFAESKKEEPKPESKPEAKPIEDTSDFVPGDIDEDLPFN